MKFNTNYLPMNSSNTHPPKRRLMLIKILALCSLLLTFGASAQVTVNLTGPSTSTLNSIETYNVSVTGGIHDASTYTVTGGTIEEETLTYVKVKWTSTGSGRTVRVDAGVVYSGYNWYDATRSVTVSSPLTGGSISASTATLVCLGDDPGTINSTSAASGGIGGIDYQWEVSAETGRGDPNNPSNWVNVSSGGTNATYNPPTQANGGDMYRRKATASSETAYSNSITYTIAGQVYAGSISYSGGNINPGTMPSQITSSSDASGGINPSYRWEQKVGTATSYSEISGTSGENNYYTPGTLNVTTSYRRKAIDCTTETTSPVTINVNFDGGSIDGSQVICPTDNPTPLTSASDPTGGLGGYDYRWYKSELQSHSGDKINGVWGPWIEVTISLSNKTYDPPVLSTEARYKREVTSGTLTEESGYEYIFFKEITSGGVITAPSSPINPGTTHGTINGTSITDAEYQWQEKVGTGNFENIPGATNQNLTGRTLDFTTSYQRIATICGDSEISNEITVEVNFDGGSIAESQTICADENPSVLTSESDPTGGVGDYDYRWYKSELQSHSGDKINGVWGPWVEVTISLDNKTYDPPVLTTETRYKREVTSGSLVDESNIEYIFFKEIIDAGTITVESPSGPVDPGTQAHGIINGTDITYATYQWQEKVGTAANFTNIDGAIYEDLSGRTIDFTTSYQRLATVCGTTLTSDPVTVVATFDPGSVGADQTVCIGDVPSTLTSSAPATGGFGNYGYVWEKSEFLPADPPAHPAPYWTTFEGADGIATNLTYDPPTTSVRTKYRRMVVSGSAPPQLSNEIEISLHTPPIEPDPLTSVEACGYTDVTRGTPTSGVTWFWQTAADGESIENDSVTVKVTSNGTVYLRARDNTTHCWSETAASLPVSVEQDNAPANFTAGNNIIVFVGEDFDLNNTGETPAISPATGSWSGTNVTGGSIFNSSSVGTVDVTYTYFTGGYCYFSANKSVEVRGTPEITAAGSTVLHRGSTVNLQLPDVAEYNYQWFKDGELLAGQTSPTLNVSNMGDYHAEVTSTNNAVTTTDVTFVDEPLLSQNQNFVRTRTMRVASPDVGTITKERLTESYTYFDGLGRQSQSIQSNASVAGFDIVVPVEYDEFGRQTKEYLPYVSSDVYGLFQKNATKDEVANLYINSDHQLYYSTTHSSNRAFTESILEASPLNRVITQIAPGEAWQTRGIDYDYLLNTTNEVIHFDWNQLLTQTKTFIPANEIMKNGVTDEDNKETIEFTNKAGQTLLKQSHVETTTWASTYYIYDDLGQLKVVIPPEAIARLDAEFFPKNTTERQDFLDTWTFQYAYDDRKRMIEKKVPGAEKVLMAYDQWDRLVLTQDGNQRLNDQWLFTKYDELNRPILTGIMTKSGDPRTDVMTHAVRSESFDATQTATHQYTSVAYPTSASGLIDEYLTLTYYDNYDFVAGSSLTGTSYLRPPELNTSDAYHILPEYHSSVKGQVTGTMTRVLGTSDFITSISYYDDRYRVIQVVSENHQGGTDIISNQYDFIGNVRRIKSVHSGSAQTNTLLEYDYDHANRLENGYHTFNGGTRVHLFSNSYNELGELVKKQLHESGAGYKQTIDYAYNIRGWLRSINESGLSGSSQTPEPADLFSMELIYNTTLSNLPTN